jgi:hypothetical protein
MDGLQSSRAVSRFQADLVDQPERCFERLGARVPRSVKRTTVAVESPAFMLGRRLAARSGFCRPSRVAHGRQVSKVVTE